MTRFLVIVIMMFYVILIIVRLRYYASCVAISLCLSALLQLPCVLRLKWQKVNAKIKNDQKGTKNVVSCKRYCFN